MGEKKELRESAQQKTPQLPLTKKTGTLRLRVFAGPNGSGKSTVINAVRNLTINNAPIDFGYYINADDIASALRNKNFPFKNFNIRVSDEEFKQTAISSGLINKDFPKSTFLSCYSLERNAITLLKKNFNERLAQVIADFLRKKLLAEGKKFSFETVFSHASKLDIMKEAVEKGYKVYLYFVSTESPEINKYRVELRVKQGGHYVLPTKIEDRYYRSLNLLYEACQIAHQAFFFDNSEEGKPLKMFSHFKRTGSTKNWDTPSEDDIPEWFKKYYSNKINT